MGELKSGMRNNADDRLRVREVRGHAQAIHDLSKELEPTDDDETMAREDMRAMDRTSLARMLHMRR